MKKRSNDMPVSLKSVAALAMLSAISIILGKYLQIPVGDTLRFSFENLPVLFAGVVFGPLSGMLVGAVADLIGCLLVGYAINPIVTLGAIMCGGVSGVCYILLKHISKLQISVKVIITVTVSHLIASVLIKTFGLAKFYDMPLGMLMLWRLLNYAIIGALECVLLTVLLKNKAVMGTVNSLLTKKGYRRGERDILNEDTDNGQNK